MLRGLLVALVRLYQVTVRPLVGNRCRFHPSCSDYAILAIRRNGALRGTGQAIWRIVRCAPWSAGGVEYPPGVGYQPGVGNRPGSAGARG